MTTSLKLQVANKALENDEITIKNLRKDLIEAQKKSEEAMSKQEIAADLIQALRLEIIQLNRRMKDQMNSEDVTHSIPQSAIFQEADNQVERMMCKKGIQFQPSATPMDTNIKVTRFKEPRGVNRPTDFQEWKMKKFLWAPDTPAGSENYDSEIVSELLQTSLHPPKGTGILRNTTPSANIKGFKYTGDQSKMKKKNLPSVKTFSRRNTDSNKNRNAASLSDDQFLKEFKNAVEHNNDRPKTSQIF